MTDTMFAAPGRFFRGNLHTHSNRSDGALEAEEVCRRYKAEGYDFLALTDHFIGIYEYPITDTVPFRDNQFTTILGAELHSGTMQNGEIWHILAVGLPQEFAPPDAPHFGPVDGQETGAEIARRARDAGAYVAIAHPQWSGMSLDDARGIEAAHAVEIYNHGCAVSADRADGFHTLDLLLSEGRKLDLCATDDAHFTEPDHFGGWVMVKAQENSPDSLLAALKAGHYYSSQGPDFHNIVWNDKSVEVDSSAVSTVIVQGQGSAAVSLHGDAMTRAEVPLMRFSNSPWLRITIVDRAGKRAWCNPVWR
ncbi:PHP domain-containing protein [Hoeflea sp. TYP-13]|uniref:PHP domain-containing protein n=1 Tax=Hoeflea sp. TYP-13 TaxID=3230023 RepID=UPI0034C66783